MSHPGQQQHQAFYPPISQFHAHLPAHFYPLHPYPQPTQQQLNPPSRIGSIMQNSPYGSTRGYNSSSSGTGYPQQHQHSYSSDLYIGSPFLAPPQAAPVPAQVQAALSPQQPLSPQHYTSRLNQQQQQGYNGAAMRQNSLQHYTPPTAANNQARASTYSFQPQQQEYSQTYPYPATTASYNTSQHQQQQQMFNSTASTPRASHSHSSSIPVMPSSYYHAPRPPPPPPQAQMQGSQPEVSGNTNTSNNNASFQSTTSSLYIPQSTYLPCSNITCPSLQPPHFGASVPSPAWATLIPCGCTLCRECISATLTSATRVRMPSSSAGSASGGGGGLFDQEGTLRQWKCISCGNMSCNFGPLHPEREPPYPISSSSMAEGNQANSPFQSAQQQLYPVSQAQHPPQAASQEAQNYASMQSSRTYAASDPPPSIQHSPTMNVDMHNRFPLYPDTSTNAQAIAAAQSHSSPALYQQPSFSVAGGSIPPTPELGQGTGSSEGTESPTFSLPTGPDSPLTSFYTDEKARSAALDNASSRATSGLGLYLPEIDDVGQARIRRIQQQKHSRALEIKNPREVLLPVKETVEEKSKGSVTSAESEDEENGNGTGEDSQVLDELEGGEKAILQTGSDLPAASSSVPIGNVKVVLPSGLNAIRPVSRRRRNSHDGFVNSLRSLELQDRSAGMPDAPAGTGGEEEDGDTTIVPGESAAIKEDTEEKHDKESRPVSPATQRSEATTPPRSPILKDAIKQIEPPPSPSHIMQGERSIAPFPRGARRHPHSPTFHRNRHISNTSSSSPSTSPTHRNRTISGSGTASPISAFDSLHRRTRTITGSSSSSFRSRGSREELNSPNLPMGRFEATEISKEREEKKRNTWWIDPFTGKERGIVKDVQTGEVRSSDGKDPEQEIGISWPILKIHNISFATTIAEIEAWLPAGIMPPLDYYAQSIHLICEASTGKTFPYAYIECISEEAANRLVAEKDESFLAGRQIKFRATSQRDLVTDLFPVFKPNREPGTYQPFDTTAPLLPLAPPAAVSAVPSLFSASDVQDLKLLFSNVSNGQRAEHGFFVRPEERPFARLASLITKYPWHTGCGTKEESDRLFDCLQDAVDTIVAMNESIHYARDICAMVIRAGLTCPGFDEARKLHIQQAWAKIESQTTLSNLTPSQASMPQETRRATPPIERAFPARQDTQLKAPFHHVHENAFKSTHEYQPNARKLAQPQAPGHSATQSSRSHLGQPFVQNKQGGYAKPNRDYAKNKDTNQPRNAPYPSSKPFPPVYNNDSKPDLEKQQRVPSPTYRQHKRNNSNTPYAKPFNKQWTNPGYNAGQNSYHSRRFGNRDSGYAGGNGNKAGEISSQTLEAGNASQSSTGAMTTSPAQDTKDALV